MLEYIPRLSSIGRDRGGIVDVVSGHGHHGLFFGFQGTYNAQFVKGGDAGIDDGLTPPAGDCLRIMPPSPFRR